MFVVFCRLFLATTDISQHDDDMESSRHRILDFAAQRSLSIAEHEAPRKRDGFVQVDDTCLNGVR